MFPAQSAKEKTSQAANLVDAQRKQIVLQQALPPGPPTNILHGPAFIFPLSQQQAAPAPSVRPGSVKSSNAGGAASSSASNSASLSASAATAAAAPALSFNYPNMAGNEPQYLAILQINAYPFPMPPHVAAAATPRTSYLLLHTKIKSQHFTLRVAIPDPILLDSIRLAPNHPLRRVRVHPQGPPGAQRPDLSKVGFFLCTRDSWIHVFQQLHRPHRSWHEEPAEVLAQVGCVLRTQNIPVNTFVIPAEQVSSSHARIQIQVIQSNSPPSSAKLWPQKASWTSEPPPKSSAQESQHLTPNYPFPRNDAAQQLKLVECASKAAKLTVDTTSLSNYMRGKHREIRDRVLDYFNKRPELQTPVEILKDDHRELCMKQLVGLVRKAGIRPFRYVVDDPAKYFAILEAVGSVDMSLGIKMGVQYSLWGGFVLNLGTKKHKYKYFDGIDNMEYPGCFAMTELHHGSNVQGLQIVAAFDPLTDEFIIDTPPLRSSRSRLPAFTTL
ncbi:acyl-coenzyme A oxidase 2 [Pyrus ussuriensis x Pyrus communis]|uniref:Acyl-coenzyme A oxidase 2 n=1 Tax=Pyrus ussuriensis x Pyrus communis TaxID=2448454 RepID=A0A5N5GGF8_9ROSA|nr:acyl-coenzyme A oxidase 2 [Pyrus ussuriensis x Pyrus communis]